MNMRARSEQRTYQAKARAKAKANAEPALKKRRLAPKAKAAAGDCSDFAKTNKWKGDVK